MSYPTADPARLVNDRFRTARPGRIDTAAPDPADGPAPANAANPPLSGTAVVTANGVPASFIT
jgi:hypothetical protein